MTPGSQHSSARPDRHEWRPVKPRATRRPAVIADPVLEPYWSGTRVLAHFRADPDSDQAPELDLIDEWGTVINEVAPAAVAALSDSVMALEAVIDGVLTDQPTRGGLGTALIGKAQVPRFAMFVKRPSEVTYQPRGKRVGGGEVAFVAVDLLSVDGQPLLDLPLLERKRQLQTLFVESELLRVSPMARPPIRAWLNSWHAAGFRGVMVKAANSRYRPGDQTVEWAAVHEARQVN